MKIRWSSNIVQNGATLYLTSTHNASGGAFSDCQHLRLQLHCFLGLGSTGAVYGATLDSDDISEEKIVLSHVIKAVAKDDSQKNGEKLERLRNELEIYRKLEACGHICDNIPRCYGSFEADSITVLLLEYAGEQLKSWDEVSSDGW